MAIRPITHFRCALLALVCLAAALPSFAGITGKIAGKVLDKTTGEPLVGAHIAIKGTRLGAATDVNGDYFIINIPPGDYAVIVSFVGFQSMTRTGVSVSADRTSPLDVALASTVIEGSMITIIAERPVINKDVTASEQILTGENLDKSGSRTVIEALQTQAGVFSTPASLAWVRGQRSTFFRGSSSVESVYMLDNLSVNSGLLSDNYGGFNTSAIQEISLLTGGYNAEYGDARSAIVNIVTKESSGAIKGSVVTRMRPAGVYHFGRSMYDQRNYDYANFDLNYWARQSQDPNSQKFYNKNPDSLLAAWRTQITPNDTLAKYNQRPEYEVEGTLYGGVTDDLNFLVSGRYKHGVGIFPQALPYNPEYNLQGYVGYKISPDIKVKIGGFYGQYESADYSSSNMNTDESAQDATWLAPMRIDEQYARAKYNPMGAIYRQWPEFRIWTQFYGRMTHMLNPDSYYEVSLSYLRDHSDRSDRYNRVPVRGEGKLARAGPDPDTLWSTRDDQIMMVDRFLLQGYYHTSNINDSKIYQGKLDYVNQIDKNHQLKTGLTFRSYDFSSDYFEGVIDGGQRTNLLNVFDGRPYEGSAYAQDKMEFSGLVINLGFRFDFFNQNRSAPANMFDPLAMEPTTPGHDPREALGIPGTPERVPTKVQTAFAPRFGISHPISDNSVLHFVYGHFFQRPSWVKMFGMPFVNYTSNPNTLFDPYAKQTTYMEEWQGWYGNPDMGYERTIQYELGFDNNIADILRLDITGYYKDASREANVITGVYSALRPTTKALMLSNSGYSDVRGIETKLESRVNSPLTGGISHEIFWSYAGEVGYSQLNEDGSTRLDVPKGLRQERGAWSSYHRIKAWTNLYVKPDEGPELGGLKPFSDFNLYLYFWWRSGEPYTYHAPGDVSTEPNNMTWFSYYQLNLKISKGFYLFGVRAELSADIRNVFNWKFLRLLDGDDMIRWQQNPDLPDSQRLPKNWYSGEPDEWQWYSYEVPPRQVYFQFKVDF